MDILSFLWLQRIELLAENNALDFFLKEAIFQDQKMIDIRLKEIFHKENLELS